MNRQFTSSLFVFSAILSTIQSGCGSDSTQALANTVPGGTSGSHVADGAPRDTGTGDMSTGATGTTFTHITAEGGTFTFDNNAVPMKGVYTEPGSTYKFGVTFKQGERNSPNPVLVATTKTTTAEAFLGKESLQFQIDDHQETGTAAYKADISLAAGHDPFHAGAVTPNDRYLGFAFKIDPSYYVLPTGQNALLFAQWHQGSPWHPAVDMSILNCDFAKSLGLPCGSNGEFVLTLRNDLHNAGGNLPGQPLIYDLGPVQTGVWLKWVMYIHAGIKTNGKAAVWLDGNQLISVTDQWIGYDPKDPQYGSAPPPPQFDWVSITLYREHGLNHQRFFYDEGKFADSFAAASP